MCDSKSQSISAQDFADSEVGGVVFSLDDAIFISDDALTYSIFNKCVFTNSF